LGQVIDFRCLDNGQQFFQCRDWSLKWQHLTIRYDYHKFELAYHWISLLESISPEASIDWMKPEGKKASPIYLHLVNSLLHLDSMETKKQNELQQVQLFFLLRLSYLLGIAPLTKECLACNSMMTLEGDLRPATFLLHEGGFHCWQCSSSKNPGTHESWLWYFWEWARLNNWKNMREKTTQGQHQVERIVSEVNQFMSHHLNLPLQRMQMKDLEGK
jgi:recombinational DNA repair protein (RecF pathway)